MSLTKTVAADSQLFDDEGNKYLFSALTFKQIGQYILWYKFKEYREAKELGVDKDLLKDIYKVCSLKDFSFESPELINSMLTPDGVRQLVYLGLQANHPDIKEDTVDKIVTVLNFEEVALEVMRQTGYITPEVKDEKSGE